MASGDSLRDWGPLDNQAPATLYATLDLVAGTSDTPDDNIFVLDFDSSNRSTQHSRGSCLAIMPVEGSRSSGNCKWDAAFKRMEDAGANLVTNTFAAR